MSEAGNTRYTVLVVDDDPDLLHLLADGLELLGNFTVVSATNGIEGLERYFEIRPDCMIIDVKMPGLDGYQLVRALRGDPESAITPIIILSALAQEQNQFAGLALGADDYLIKLVDIYEVVAAVERAVHISVAEREQRMQALLTQTEATRDDWLGASSSQSGALAEQER
jgi:DNA-binding response OmpR family regulator